MVVAGVPGTGKTVVGSRLARRLGLGFVTLSWLVLEKGLWRGYDRARRSFVIDEDALCREVAGLQGVVETHWLEPFIECARPSLVVVTRASPLVLVCRLLRRGWPLGKVVENVEAELLGVVAAEAREALARGVRVVEVDTTAAAPENCVERVLRALSRGEGLGCCKDWLSELRQDELGLLFEKVLKPVSSPEELGAELCREATRA